MILAADIGTAGFGAICAVGGALVLVFRHRWHAMWWRGSRGVAPADEEFERGVYQWGTVGFGVALVVVGVAFGLTGLHG